jgi:hypothetical protein
MDGLLKSVGHGITSLVAGAFDAIGGALRGIFHAAQVALPGGLLFVVIFIVVAAGGWILIKR